MLKRIGLIFRRLSRALRWHGPTPPLRQKKTTGGFIQSTALADTGDSRDSALPQENALTEAVAPDRAEHTHAMYRVGASEHIQSLHAEIEESPNDPTLRVALGDAFAEKGSLREAIETWELAAELDDSRIDVWQRIGNAWSTLEIHDRAAEAFREGLAKNPSDIDLRFGLAIALINGGRKSGNINKTSLDALSLIEQIWREYSSPRLGKLAMAMALNGCARLAEASVLYSELVNDYPDDPELAQQFAINELALGHPRAAYDNFLRAFNLEPGRKHAATGALWALNYVAGVEPAEILLAHKKLSAQCWKKTPANPWTGKPQRSSSTIKRRIRIGYVSPDFRTHPVGLLLEPVIKHHDRSNFDLFAYSNTSKEDIFTHRFRMHIANWRDIQNIDDAAAADLVRGDEIDILIDLAGYTADNRLGVFAERPAPVQMAWLGYMATTGLETIDYIISDPHSSPDEQQDFYSERILRMPFSRFCYSPPEYMQEVPERRPLRAGQVTFGSFNNIAKINTDVLAAWARILELTPRSRLIVGAGSGLDDEVSVNEFRTRAERCGIDTSRLELRGHSNVHEYVGGYADIDIALDTFPFSGGMTTFDALWMGVPTITLTGPLIASRQTFSVLKNIGLDSLASTDVEGYVRSAAALAFDMEVLGGLHTSIRGRIMKSPIGDCAQFTRDLEQIYRAASAGDCPRTLDR